MPDITLRAYSKEIDDLIEHDQLDEAIAHCRHILQTYPKHLATYRALGKSYLEAKRYGDAADIFQRVLSAIPDDFVSHIGMSIVREDEGNLDSSIWHMERAFETNPANPAIQQELRRLLGRRDGLEPHKVRLTRGALARMYAQGELYPQAIAELRSALAEENDRPDLNVLLAKMFWNTEQLAEAVDVCHLILDALPFCLEANRIMAAVLQMTGKSDDARAYQRRMVALDPYMAFLENPKADPHTVDAVNVRLAKLDWVPGQPMPTSELGGDWTETLGVDSTPQPATPADDGDLPAWMADLEKQQAPPPAQAVTPAPTPDSAPSLGADSQPFSGAIPADDGSIPEWMREAGWTESDGEAPEGPVQFSDEELTALEDGQIPQAPPADDGELAPAEIPGWLQDIAPADTGTAPPEQPAAKVPSPPSAPEAGDEPEIEASVPDWLSDIAADAAEVAPEPDLQAAETSAELAPDSAGGDVPSWLDASSPGATSTIVTWLGDRTYEDGVVEEPSEEASQEPDAGDLPTWMSGGDKPEPEAEGEVPPSWLSGVAEAAAQPEIAAPIIPPQESTDESAEEASAGDPEAPDWLQAIASSDSDDESEDVEQGESPDWLSDLRSIDDDVSDDETQETSAEAEGEAENSADWLSRIASEEPEPAAPADISDSEDVLEQDIGEDLEDDVEEDWLSRLTDPEDEAPSEDPPQWMRGEGTAAPASTASEPDWLNGLAESEPEDVTADTESESLDWLDGIAEDEPASADDGALDWLAGIEEEPSPEEPVDSTEPAMEVPDWMQDDVAAAPKAEPVASEEMEWLQEFKEASDEPTVESAPAMEATEPDQMPTDAVDLTDADDGEVMQWLETLAEQQGEVVEQPAPSPEPSAPTIPEVAPAEASIPDSEVEGLDWLEELADSRGIDDTIEIAPSSGDEGLGWLQDMAEPEQQSPADATASVAPEPADLPAEEIQPHHEEPQQAVPSLEETAPAAEEIPPELESAQPVIPSTPVAEAPPEIVPAAAEIPSVAVQPSPAPLIDEERLPAPAESVVEEPAREDIPAPEATIMEPAASPPVDTRQPEPEPARVEEDPFTAAHAMLAAGDATGAAKLYGKLIKRGKNLEEIIATLRTSLQEEPHRPEIWQALGDAYMKNGQMNDAVDAYQRGMEVA